jgi:hypothetical protein
MNIRAKRVTNEDYLIDPGNFAIRFLDDEPQGMIYVCPCGCKRQGYLPFKNAQYTTENGPSWEFDGNLDFPTLQPSILDKACKWHGWLRNGLFVT